METREGRVYDLDTLRALVPEWAAGLPGERRAEWAGHAEGWLDHLAATADPLAPRKLDWTLYRERLPVDADPFEVWQATEAFYAYARERRLLRPGF